ncbi:hypothetical protein CKM354_001083100 [Cercospora kikuchii]|uniref:Uncharacterized protein n=1 Tax=Cercospora kikuchii TaxID=84275 RepID=A0A9P3FHP5_9PEZI|nr:uncharacterized protein CKM354_001083100 [Cercospora kikuchii]GIZ47746.1 hypothetical protein CKM354_001083100 [Cercospora kikuchii]
MVKSTASTEKPKRAGFMDLSAELRNRIYRYALVSPVPLRVAPISSDSGTVIKVASFYYLSPGLLATCRQIHQEATAMLYGGNTLHFWFAYMDSSIKPFLDAIGNSRRLIRSIVLEGHGLPAHEASWALLAQASGLQTIQVQAKANQLRSDGVECLAACVSSSNCTSQKPYDVVSLQVSENPKSPTGIDFSGNFKEELQRHCALKSKRLQLAE